MIKIDKIVAKHFKNIENANVFFGSLNVLVGPNGSGKSNFLLITSFLDMIVNGSNESVKLLFKNGYSSRVRHFYTKKEFIRSRKNTPSEPIEIEIDYSDTTSGYIYSYGVKICVKDEIKQESDFKIHSEHLSYKQKSSKGKPILLMSQRDGLMTINKVITNSFVDVKMTDSSTSGIKILDVIFKTNSNLNDNLGHIMTSLNTVLKTKTVYLSSHAMKYYDSDSLGGAEGRLVKFDLEEQIREIYGTDKWITFIDAVKSVTNISNILVIKADDNKDKIVKDESFVAYIHKSRVVFLADLSDGEILLIGLISQIITSTQDIIFFEELENSIHPKALESLISLMNSRKDDKQILISTHSVTLLNMVKPENVFIAVINDDSLAEITMIADIKEMKRKLSKGFINFGDLLYQGNDDKFEDIFE